MWGFVHHTLRCRDHMVVGDGDGDAPRSVTPQRRPSPCCRSLARRAIGGDGEWSAVTVDDTDSDGPPPYRHPGGTP